MKDPKRLLDFEAGLAREILQLASCQAAPEDSVANVLRAVDLALEGEPELGMNALIHESDLSARAEQIARSRLPRSPSRIRFWAKFGLAPKASTLIPAGAALAAALGGSVIVGGLLAPARTGVIEGVESTSRPRQGKALTPSATAVRVPISEPSLALAESSAALLLDAPGAAREGAPVEPGGTSTIAPRPLSSARSPLDEGWSTKSAAFEDDWLGEQFALIARARRNLDAGNSAEALEILDDYARRFPEGTLGHQAAALRQRVDEAISSGPRRGEPFDLGI